nr:hypothetical protein [Tanacetum cinerariifolium]
YNYVGYSTQSRAYIVFNKRTRVIMESIHVNFDELPHKALVHNSSDPALTRQKMASVHHSTDPGPTCQKMASVQISSDPAPKCQTMALEHNSLSPGRNCQENVSHKTVIPRHEKTPYHIINERKLSVKFFHIFGSVCYIVKDGENLDKMKEKCDECIFVGYSTESRTYRVFNKRTRVIMESIHVNFDQLPQMASVQNSSGPAPTCQTMASFQISSDPTPECQTVALEHNSLSPGRKCQDNVSHRDKTGTTSNELDLLFSLMFDELLNGSSKVVSKSSDVSAADAPYQRQQPTTPLNNHTTPAPLCQTPTHASTVRSSENINQAEPHDENDQVADDEFINIFSTPVQDRGETSSRHVDSSNMHTFYQRYSSEQRWTKDHMLEQVIGNPS